MRFFWLLLTVGGITAAFMAKTAGLLGMALIVTFVAGLCAVFSFAAARIESSSRPDSALMTPEVLAAVRAHAAKQQAGQPAARPAAPSTLPPGPPRS